MLLFIENRVAAEEATTLFSKLLIFYFLHPTEERRFSVRT
jgi:hypothetical protein